jgi:L-2-hydroxyglutarate oxidase LhgO
MRSLMATDADYVFRHELVSADFTNGSWILGARDPAGHVERFSAARVVNTAGLDADRVAALAGFDVDARGWRQRLVKGNYFRLKRAPTKHLVYPLPEKLGVGVHVTLDLDGSARLGPDVEEDFRSLAVDESRRGAFFAAASRYLVGISPEDLSPDQAGLRPKLPGGDFVVDEDGGFVNLVGIESPGLTCCLELAARVSMLLS